MLTRRATAAGSATAVAPVPVRVLLGISVTPDARVRTTPSAVGLLHVALGAHVLPATRQASPKASIGAALGVLRRPWMAARACARLVDSHRGCSPSLHVHAMRHGLKVARIAAGRDPAQVVELSPLGDRSDDAFVGDAVDPDGSPLPIGHLHLHLAVPERCLGTRPDPAFVGRLRAKNGHHPLERIVGSPSPTAGPEVHTLHPHSIAGAM